MVQFEARGLDGRIRPLMFCSFSHRFVLVTASDGDLYKRTLQVIVWQRPAASQSGTTNNTRHDCSPQQVTFEGFRDESTKSGKSLRPNPAGASPFSAPRGAFGASEGVEQLHRKHDQLEEKS